MKTYKISIGIKLCFLIILLIGAIIISVLSKQNNITEIFVCTLVIYMFLNQKGIIEGELE